MSDLRESDQSELPETESEGGAGRPVRSIDGRRGDRHLSQFQLRGKRFLLTYPQTGWAEGVTSATTLCQRLGANRYLVCRENHADGSQHIHVYLEVPGRISTRDEHFFDLFLPSGVRKHGNYQVVRSPRGAAAYVLKDDQYESFGFSAADIQQLKRLNRGKSSLAILTRGLAGERLETIALDYPEIVIMRDMQKVQAQIDRVRNYNPEHAKRIVEKITMFNYTYSFDAAKACRGPGGNLHPWIWGNRGTGKSSLFRATNYRFYCVDDVCNWVDYDDANYDAILFDECTPSILKKIGFSLLNKLLDGVPVRLNNKGGHVYVQKKMPIFFCSNWDIQQVKMPEDPGWEAFLSRLLFLQCIRCVQGPTYSFIIEDVNQFLI